MKITKKKVTFFIIILVLVFPLKKYIQTKQFFYDHLKNNYPKTSFEIGMIKYDPIYPKIYAKVKSDDGIEFIIKKPPGEKKIYEHYLREKYEKDTIVVIEKYIGNDLLKNIDFIRCHIDYKKIKYDDYTIDDLLNNIDSIAISYKSKSMNNFNEFFDVASKIFEKLNNKNIQVKESIHVYTYTSDNLDCDLSKEKESYVLRVMVVAEDITTNEQYQQKRKGIQEIVKKSKIKITRVNISCKGDLK